MNKISSYPKVLALGERYIQDIFKGKFIIEEKIDGSQISFGMIDGELRIRSKGAIVHVDGPDNMFKKGVESIVAVKDKLIPNAIYRGEYLLKPKHNALAYSRIPDNHIIIFDIEVVILSDETNESFGCVGYDEKLRLSKELGFETVPLLALNEILKDKFMALLENESCLGGQKIEGFVVKNYDRFTLDGKFMAGKYVSEAFKERHATQWKKNNPSRKDVLMFIVSSLKTEARYHKAVQALRDMELLEGSPRDIGKLFKMVHKDIDEEETEYIKEKLFEHFIPDIKRGVCHGLPEWYKEKLLESAVKE